MPSNSRGSQTSTTKANRAKAQQKSVSANAAPVVRATSAALNKRQLRAAQRAAERRRRTNIISGVVAVIVVGALALLLKDHMPGTSANGAKPAGQSSTYNCPATPTSVVGPSAAVTPAPAPPSLPSGAKTVNGDQGLQYVDITAGCGPAVKAGDNVVVNYTGWLQSTGKMFDSSYNAGRTPFEVDNVGQASVITGWNLGLIGMKPGGTRRLIIPGDLAYGSAGAPQGGIPPNATLVFDVTVVSIK